MTKPSITRRRLLAGISTATALTLAGCAQDDTTTEPGDTETDAPADTTEEPADTTEEPGDTTEEPGDTTEEPGDTTEEPGDTTEEPGDTTEEPDGEGRVRAAHMSPNAPNVDIYVDGSAALEDVPFGAVSDYLTVAAGDHEVTITPAGDAETEVFSGTVTVNADTDYTIVATGEVGDQADEPFAPLVLEDDNSEVESGMARIRAVHASPDAPAVDITAAGGDAVLFDGVAFGGSGYTTVDAGSYTVQIRGDTDSNDGDVVAEFDVTLEDGGVYTAFAAGYLSPDDEPADTPFDLILAQDSGA